MTGSFVRVSIILPSLNAKRYIDECLQSILGQTLKEIEVLCVDAGSDDGTRETIESYAAHDSRVKLILSERKSYGYQMNLGISMAKGKYVGIVEADDVVAPDMYQELYDVAEENSVDFVKADFYRFTEINGKRSMVRNIVAREGYCRRVINPSEEQICFNFPMNTWSGIYRLEFLKKNGIRHHESPGAAFQDNGFWFQTFMHARRAYFVDKPYYMNRRDNPDSSVFDQRKAHCICEEYEYIGKFLEKDAVIFDRYKCLYAYFAYRNYKWMLEIIPYGEKPAFFRRFAALLQNFHERKMLEGKIFLEFNKQALYEMHAILKDPEWYYEQIVKEKHKALQVAREYPKVIIYGASMLGKQTYDGLAADGMADKVLGFAVTRKLATDAAYRGCPLYSIDELLEERQEALVLVAVTVRYRGEVRAVLEEKGFCNIAYALDAEYLLEQFDAKMEEF